MAVDVTGAPAFEAGVPHALFDKHRSQAETFSHGYDVTADGQRFILVSPVQQATISPITVVVNWQAGLKK